MPGLTEVLVIDSVVPNADDVAIEAQTLAGTGKVRGIKLKDETELPDWFEQLDAIIVWHQVKLMETALKRLKKCRIIVRNGVGFDNVDLKVAGSMGIAVCNVPDYGTEEVADHSIALALAVSRNLFAFREQTQRLEWDWKIGTGILKRIRGRVFGIIGLGRIGTAVALRAKAFGYDVVFYDPHLAFGVEKAIGIRRAWSLDELLKQSDLISIHCPLSEETEGMLGREQFAVMKEGVFLVNTARGRIIDQYELKKALQFGKVAGAGLDVLNAEPPDDPELVNHPNVIVTPHAAFYSQESFDECRRSSAVIVKRFFEEGIIMNLVNQEYLKTNNFQKSPCRT